MSKLDRLRYYAQQLSAAVERLIDAVKSSLAHMVKFFQNLFAIFIVTIRRGLELIWTDLFDFLKSVAHLLIDALRWPVEHLILPASRWLDDQTTILLDNIEGRDEYALGAFLLIIVLCGLCAWVVIAVF